jgi:hypothetical protein
VQIDHPLSCAKDGDAYDAKASTDEQDMRTTPDIDDDILLAAKERLLVIRRCRQAQ